MAKKRRGLVRFQIFLLVVLAAIVVIRVVKGPPPPEGLVVFVDLKPFQLYHKAFELGERADVAVRATGSFDQEAMPVGLAAQGWMIRHDSRELVWGMDPQAVAHGPGSLAEVQGDTFALEAGRYDVFFATFGQAEEHRNRPRWRSEADRWLFVLDLVDETAPARVLHGERLVDLETPAEHLVWRKTRLSNGQEEEYLFEVKTPARLDVYAVGEIDNEPQDYAWIEDAATGTHVWGFSRDNTEPAGGLPGNRRYRGTLDLKPGAYRAVVKTNRRHAFHAWEGNPPYDPVAWGLTLSTPDAGAIAAFDPWISRQPIVSFTRVPDDARRSQRFEVVQPIQVVLYAVGEMTSPDEDDAYDYGTLIKEETVRKRTVWKMTWDASVHAGGSEKNRLEVAFLRLDPGVYALRYETDGSHAFGEWNAGKPDYPERWGATLFPMAAALDSGVVQLLETPDADAWAAPNTPPRPSVAHAGEALVAWTRLRGEVEKSQTFTLENERTLHVVALGEITARNRYDYGWIERADTGEVVWEMTPDNTFPAGGGESNRRFDDVITLGPGRYVVHFVSDASYHFGAFGDEAPDHAEDWGITVYLVASEG